MTRKDKSLNGIHMKHENIKTKKFRKTVKYIYSPVQYSKNITLFENATIINRILVLTLVIV